MVEKLFLDANILFSAAYSEKSSLLRLWKLKKTVLYSSLYAIEEANRNLPEVRQQSHLNQLLNQLEIIRHEHITILLSDDIILREKDRPILQAAIHAKAHYLITGDFRDFGKYFGKSIQNVTILPPVDYFKTRGMGHDK